ncbi:hypothetical protein RJ639_033981, partial [Escallonia herrerae]
MSATCAWLREGLLFCVAAAEAWSGPDEEPTVFCDMAVIAESCRIACTPAKKDTGPESPMKRRPVLWPSGPDDDMAAPHHLAHVNCGNCCMMLMYPYGAQSVKCDVCQHVTNVNAKPQSQSQIVVVQNSMSIDESGKL